MTEKETLSAHEEIMAAVCDLCHWPFVYQDEETMWAERCDFCPAAAKVTSVLDGIRREAGHD